MAKITYKPNKFLSIIKWVLIVSPLFIVILFSLSFYSKFNNVFYPGVTIAGEAVGGRNYEEVFNKYKIKANTLKEQGLILNLEGENGEKRIEIPMYYSGLTTDKVVEYFSLAGWEEKVKEAYSVGRAGSFFEKLNDQFRAGFWGKDIAFPFAIQKEPLDSLIKNETSDFLSKSYPAHFAYNQGQVFIENEVIGEKINTEKIVNAFSQKLSKLDDSPLSLKTEKDAVAVKKENLEPFLGKANNISKQINLVFKYKDYSWKAKGSALATWLTAKDGKMSVNETALDNYFKNTAALYIDSPVKNSRFEIRDNKLIEISRGAEGNAIDVKKTAEKIEENLSVINFEDESEPINIDIPIEITKVQPSVTKETIDKYGIRELVGKAETNFEGGSADRQKNIEVGVSKLNGILIGPGEEFSAVNALGEITEEAGFVKEYVIKGTKTVKELGGGLCQIATTLFRLGLDTGLPITERQNHRYVISYYGAGLDATIYGPHPDLRFINDTNNYILLQGKTLNNRVILEFYGKKDGRVIEISEPELSNKISPPPERYVPTPHLPLGKLSCTEIPHNGVTADVLYTVSYKNGDKKETNFHSVYQPWQKVCLIGTAQ